MTTLFEGNSITGGCVVLVNGKVIASSDENKLAKGSSGPESIVNQCDGCISGLPVNEKNTHIEIDGRPIMKCQKSRYESV